MEWLVDLNPAPLMCVYCFFGIKWVETFNGYEDIFFPCRLSSVVLRGLLLNGVQNVYCEYTEYTPIKFRLSEECSCYFFRPYPLTLVFSSPVVYQAWICVQCRTSYGIVWAGDFKECHGRNIAN